MIFCTFLWKVITVVVNNKFLVVKLLRALGGCLGTRRR